MIGKIWMPPSPTLGEWLICHLIIIHSTSSNFWTVSNYVKEKEIILFWIEIFGWYPFCLYSSYHGYYYTGTTFRCLMCAGFIAIGLLIASEPHIFGLHSSSSSDNQHERSLLYRILWPLAFTLAFVPAAIMNVLMEKEFEDDDDVGWIIEKMKYIIDYVNHTEMSYLWVFS